MSHLKYRYRAESKQRAGKRGGGQRWLKRKKHGIKAGGKSVGLLLLEKDCLSSSFHLSISCCGAGSGQPGLFVSPRGVSSDMRRQQVCLRRFFPPLVSLVFAIVWRSLMVALQTQGKVLSSGFEVL